MRPIRSLSCVTLLATACIAHPLHAADEPNAPRGAAVTVLKVSKSCFSATVEIAGLLIPREEIAVRPDRLGLKVTDVLVEARRKHQCRTDDGAAGAAGWRHVAGAGSRHRARQQFDRCRSARRRRPKARCCSTSSRVANSNWSGWCRCATCRNCRSIRRRGSRFSALVSWTAACAASRRRWSRTASSDRSISPSPRRAEAAGQFIRTRRHQDGRKLRHRGAADVGSVWQRRHGRAGGAARPRRNAPRRSRVAVRRSGRNPRRA